MFPRVFAGVRVISQATTRLPIEDNILCICHTVGPHRDTILRSVAVAFDSCACNDALNAPPDTQQPAYSCNCPYEANEHNGLPFAIAAAIIVQQPTYSTPHTHAGILLTLADARVPARLRRCFVDAVVLSGSLACCFFVVTDIVGVLADPPGGVQLDSGFHFLVAEVRVVRTCSNLALISQPRSCDRRPLLLLVPGRSLFTCRLSERVVALDLPRENIYLPRGNTCPWRCSLFCYPSDDAQMPRA